MNNNKVDNPNGSLTKLASLRQSKSAKPQKVDISKAIDGFASSIDNQSLMAEIARNSSEVNFIIDCSGSMDGTSRPIANEINNFATRQARKIYTTKLSLTLFDDRIYPKFVNIDSKQFVPINPWNCPGNTNIYDAIIYAIAPVKSKDVNHRLHLIITDGQNGGSEHSLDEVQNLIKSKISCGEHIFLLYNDEYMSSNSAKTYASELGINPNNAVNFNRSGDGIKIIFQTIEDLLDGLRTTGTVPADWAKAIEAHAANPMGIKARDTKLLY